MTSVNLNGSGVDSTSGFTGNDYVWSYANLPSAPRLAANGKRPILIDSVRVYAGGNGGTRTINPWVASSSGSGKVYGSAFTAASGQAALSSSRSLSGAGKLFSDVDGGNFRVGFDFGSGLTYFGRNADSGNNVSDSAGVIPIAAGDGLAGSYVYLQVPSAPLALNATQAGVTTAQLTWSAPTADGDSNVTGYKVQWSTSSTFATDVHTITQGTTRSATIANLPTGSLIYFRVAALNAVASEAGTSGPYSSTDSLQLIATTGDLDSWETFGVYPSGVSPVTTEGLRRAVVNAIAGAPNALLKENNVTTAPKTLTADTYGAVRMITGLTVGKTYRLQAECALTVSEAIGAATPNVYQLGVQSIGWGAPVTLALANTKYTLPSYEFVATATSHAIGFRLAEAVTRSSTGELERFAIWGVTLSEIPSDSGYRLQDVAYESSLLNHFDLACNSVGARWWVDRYGVTQFSADLGDAAPVATFSDETVEGEVGYVRIRTSYDTRNVVNDLDVNQHGRTLNIETGEYETDDTTVNAKDETSIATWGPRSDSIDVSLYEGGTHAGAVAQRVAAIFADSSAPQLVITEITWNAQELPELVSKLEIYQRVNVRFKGVTQPSRIVNVKHRMTPTRWLIDIQLVRA